ncbi:hypothetical protein HEP81_04640 [Streptomyces griseofuscus]|uniref:Uncharacterized protein n=1 Tax=Streptomyces griseofuscus TaxID=146922 RepID=A0A7H1Q3N3_9ACTN|nr:hypothetical protein [Streptomyces griseofuscus]QNT94913.1 hypothetical protein HEP81_04640 [Streptomyces griseofuscus]
MDQTRTPLLHLYWDLEDSDISDGLFEGPWNTRTLAYELAATFSPNAAHPKRRQFLAEYESDGWGGWVRGNICRALAAEGVTLHTINRRKS